MSDIEMILCLVLSTIRYKGIVLTGEEVELPEDVVLRLEQQDPCPIQRVDVTEQIDERQAEVFATIAELDPDNEKHFTKDGKPELKPLNEALKKADRKTVKGAERDQYWEEYQAANPAKAPGAGGADGDTGNQGNKGSGKEGTTGADK